MTVVFGTVVAYIFFHHNLNGPRVMWVRISLAPKNVLSKFSKSFNSQKYCIKKNANIPSLSQKT